MPCTRTHVRSTVLPAAWAKLLASLLKTKVCGIRAGPAWMPGVCASEFTVADFALLARPGSTSHSARTFSTSQPSGLSAFDISRSNHILGLPIAVARGDQTARGTHGINFIKFSCHGHGRMAETRQSRFLTAVHGSRGSSNSLHRATPRTRVVQSSGGGRPP